MSVAMRYDSAVRTIAPRCRLVPVVWCLARFALIAAACFSFQPSPAWADEQEADANAEDELDAKPAAKPPFVSPAAKVETLEALEDFRRAITKKSWDKAFKEIDKLVAETSVGLVPAKDGLQLPLRSAVAEDLAKLPPAGKNAYRLFHDAEAKKLWDQVQTLSGNEELDKLTRLATLELITSVGDLAANRLGDLLFEQGDMLGAIEAWRRVLDYRTDSSLPRAQLLVKTGIAMANAGRWRELEEIQQQLQQRHAGEMVTLGEKKVAASEHIDRLLQNRKAITNTAVATAIRPDLAFDEKVEPIWQFRFDVKDNPNRQVIRRWNNFGMMEVVDLFNARVMTAVTEDALYGNWMGCDFALDLATGKLRWRNGRIQETIHRTRQNQNQGGWVPGDRFFLTVQGNSLWTISQPPQQQNVNQGNQQIPGANLRVVQRELATGKELFQTHQVEELKQYVLIGSPLPADNLLYLTVCKQNQPSELYVVAVQVNTQRILWTTHVGTYQFNPQQGGMNTIKPTMLLYGARLYVDSHAGGLTELQANTGALRWACNYPSSVPQQQRFWGWWGYEMPTQTVFGPDGPMLGGGALYVKGMQSARLVALRPDGSAIDWKRSVPTSSIIAGSDDERIYLAGEESLAYSLKTRDLLWANSLPAGSAWVRPLLTQNRYYQFTPRGIYELDKSTGDVVRLIRGADRDSQGGAILTTPKLLITVSSRAITAYPMQGSAEVAQRDPPPSAKATEKLEPKAPAGTGEPTK